MTLVLPLSREGNLTGYCALEVLLVHLQRGITVTSAFSSLALF